MTVHYVVRVATRNGKARSPLPASLQARSDREAIFEDIAVYRGMTIEQRSQVVSELCALAVKQLNGSPNSRAAWAYEEPRSAESLALWKRLMRESRGDE